jgi:hypothetical protein
VGKNASTWGDLEPRRLSRCQFYGRVRAGAVHGTPRADVLMNFKHTKVAVDEYDIDRHEHEPRMHVRAVFEDQRVPAGVRATAEKSPRPRPRRARIVQRERLAQRAFTVTVSAAKVAITRYGPKAIGVFPPSRL